MVRNTMVSGSSASTMESGPSSGQTAVSTRASGAIAVRMVEASSQGATALFTKVSGLMESIMEEANYKHQMVKYSQELSRTANF